MDTLFDIIKGLFFIFFTLIIILFLILSLCCSVTYFDSILDKSLCSLYIDDKNVYSGRCHFLSISSIGENGNTKEAVIYKDVLKLQPLKKYVSNNVAVEEMQ